MKLIFGGIRSKFKLALFLTSYVIFSLSLPGVLSKKSGDGQSQRVSTRNLFGTGSNSLSWDNDELSKVKNMFRRGFDDEQEFSSSGNLAAYLNLDPVEALHLPLPLSLLFIGFDGEGNRQIQLSNADLQRWFRHVDSILPHARVHLNDLTCAEDGLCNGLVRGVYSPSPAHSFVHLNFTCHVTAVRGGAVTAAFQRALHAFSRPVDPNHPHLEHHVDMARMDAFLSHLVSSLDLDAAAYSIIVANPMWPKSDPMYGYRLGTSTAELRFLKTHIPLMRRVLKSFAPAFANGARDEEWERLTLTEALLHAERFPSEPKLPPLLGLGRGERGGEGLGHSTSSSSSSDRQRTSSSSSPLPPPGSAKHAVIDVQGESAQWVKNVSTPYLLAEETYFRDLLRIIAEQSAQMIHSHHHDSDHLGVPSEGGPAMVHALRTLRRAVLATPSVGRGVGG
eukprot:CAMPEP_0175064242 /NCGR_PEP_ID=MMETSP0052_2-20121109/15210_1 /TAXON_ID=51329 ORGANISM="Polytomella parva, Strain SAG 63-3" /NCGR_SAMPLE_ID=MMETSP0052_2 /ASSEMBLY_ACC=CAM_ASM_000194 /LENGTH=448 /DNA_ID=CAMNT_0016330543 /DNA_START=24 /DNA_END=1367 /DNA_ORIENTATION=+